MHEMRKADREYFLSKREREREYFLVMFFALVGLYHDELGRVHPN